VHSSPRITALPSAATTPLSSSLLLVLFDLDGVASYTVRLAAGKHLNASAPRRLPLGSLQLPVSGWTVSAGVQAGVGTVVAVADAAATLCPFRFDPSSFELVAYGCVPLTAPLRWSPSRWFAEAAGGAGGAVALSAAALVAVPSGPPALLPGPLLLAQVCSRE
jgi:hypothetical protein